MIKIIFLDIDGVIATPKTIVDGMWGLTPICQSRLGYVIEKTGAKIVISSSWRTNDTESTIKHMIENGFLFYNQIIGITIRAYHYIEKGAHISIPRGVEIKQWIDTHIHSDNGKNYSKKRIGVDYNYVILDDDVDMLIEQMPHFINTKSSIGLSRDDAYKAVQILNNER